MPIQIFAPTSGRTIGSLDEWAEHAPPKSRSAQWVDHRSAKELARAWCPAGTPPAVPDEIAALLDVHPDLRGTSVEDVYPERRVRFDNLRGEPRNADLVMVGTRGTERIAISVEAKADEPFDRTVKTVRESVNRKIRAGAPSRGLERIDHLIEALLPTATRGGAAALRYQLFTATAGALAFASEIRATRAVLVIHEFVREPGSRSIRRNAQDLNAFVTAVSGGAGAEVNAETMMGPITVPGSRSIPGSIPLYIGKAQQILAA